MSLQFPSPEILENTIRFISEHSEADPTSLALGKGRLKDIDIDLAINTLESRRKLRGKMPQWYGQSGMIFPAKLSAEQCSSTMTGRYKAALAAMIAGGKPFRIADLTGGLGVDSWYFSMEASEVLYNEMQRALCMAAEHNFRILGAGNIQFSNKCIIPENDARRKDSTNLADFTTSEGKANYGEEAIHYATASEILSGFKPDIIYADPARRSESGRKVFLIEECSPDILSLKEELFALSRHILLKLSPMADISMVCSRLGASCRQVHVIGASGECKELLIWMDREWSGDYTVKVVELLSEGESVIEFTPEEEKTVCPAILSENAVRRIQEDASFSQRWMFEPGKALMKAGAFSLVSARGGMFKTGISTHYYIGTYQQCAEYSGLGKIFEIIRCEALDKGALRQAAVDFPKADVTARNLPADTETYRKILQAERKKLKKSTRRNDAEAYVSVRADDFHIFCLRADKAGPLLIVGRRLSSSDVQDGEGQAQLSQD